MSIDSKNIYSLEQFERMASEFLEHRDLERCLHCTEEAIRLGADPLTVCHSRWMCFMLRGEFERAWQETDRTERARRLNPQSQDGWPLHFRRVWDGSSLHRKSVLVRCYHGLGDTIQFVRYISPLAEKAERIYLQCQRDLISILQFSLTIGAVEFCSDQLDRACQAEIEIMELPYAFRSTIETIPRDVPYLRVPASAIEKARPCSSCDSLNVGIVWSSGSWDARRNIPLNDFKILRNIPRLGLFSLQHGPAAVEACNFPELHLPLRGTASGTVLDTAAAILNMDLIISVDTMVAHLAGALGKPVWMVLPFCADWRWMVERDDSPWYPTMRLFRQPAPNDWQSVIDQAGRALRTVAENRDLLRRTSCNGKM